MQKHIFLEISNLKKSQIYENVSERMTTTKERERKESAHLLIVNEYIKEKQKIEWFVCES